MTTTNETRKGTKMTTINCCSQVNNGHFCQESYETASRDAGRRVRQLRKAGYTVHSCSMGSQVTPLGLIKLTLVDIRPGSNQDTFYLPSDGWQLVDWPRH